MTRITFAQIAQDDLQAIEAYYSDISQKTWLKVRDDIAEALLILETHPESGVVRRNVQRRVITTKFRYVIIYIYDEDVVEIIGIYRFQDR